MILVLALVGVLAFVSVTRFLARKIEPVDPRARSISVQLETAAAVYHAHWVASQSSDAPDPAPKTSGASPVSAPGYSPETRTWFLMLEANAEGYPDRLAGQPPATGPDVGDLANDADEACATLFRALLGRGHPTVAVRGSAASKAAAVDARSVDSVCRYYPREVSSRDPILGDLLYVDYDPRTGRTRLGYEGVPAAG